MQAFKIRTLLPHTYMKFYIFHNEAVILHNEEIILHIGGDHSLTIFELE